MGLFSRKKTKPAPVASIPPYKSLLFECSKGFRGYKRYRLTTYGYEPIQRGIDALKIPNPKYQVDPEVDKYIFDLVGKQVEIRLLLNNDSTMPVFVNGNQIGTYFANSDEEKQLMHDFANGKIESVHVRIEWAPQNIISTNKKGKLEVNVEERYKSFLFVKRSES